MKPYALLLLTVVCGAASAQVVLVDTKNKVIASIENVAQRDYIRRTVTWADSKASKTFVTNFTSDGTYCGGEFKVTSETNPIFAQISVIPTGARLITQSNGGTKMTEVPRFDNLTLTDPSVNWFKNGAPVKGATAKFMSFDPERRYWEEVSVTYNGRGKLGDSPEGHLVTRKSSSKTIRLVLDDKGDPLVWEEGRLRLVRRNSSS